MSRCWTHTASGGGLPEGEKRASHFGPSQWRRRPLRDEAARAALLDGGDPELGGGASCRGTLVVGGGNLCVMEKRELRCCACRASGGGHRKMGRARRAAMPWRSAAATS